MFQNPTRYHLFYCSLLLLISFPSLRTYGQNIKVRPVSSPTPTTRRSASRQFFPTSKPTEKNTLSINAHKKRVVAIRKSCLRKNGKACLKLGRMYEIDTKASPQYKAGNELPDVVKNAIRYNDKLMASKGWKKKFSG